MSYTDLSLNFMVKSISANYMTKMIFKNIMKTLLGHWDIKKFSMNEFQYPFMLPFWWHEACFCLRVVFNGMQHFLTREPVNIRLKEKILSHNNYLEWKLRQHQITSHWPCYFCLASVHHAKHNLFLVKKDLLHSKKQQIKWKYIWIHLFDW